MEEKMQCNVRDACVSLLDEVEKSVRGCSSSSSSRSLMSPLALFAAFYIITIGRTPSSARRSVFFFFLYCCAVDVVVVVGLAF